MITCFFILFLSIIASFIQRVSGFGFGIFVMMFFPFLLPSYGESVMLSGLLAGSTALMIAIRNWKYIRWSLMGIVTFFNVLFSFLATQYMRSMSNEVLKQCLGVFFVFIALYFLFGEGRMGRILKSIPAQSIIGSISGIMGEMFAMPGPPLVLYCVSTLQDKREYVTTLQAFSVVFNVFYTIFRFQAGFCTENIGIWWLIGLLGTLVGSSIGSLYFEVISNYTLKRIVYVMMIVSGIMAIL